MGKCLLPPVYNFTIFVRFFCKIPETRITDFTFQRKWKLVLEEMKTTGKTDKTDKADETDKTDETKKTEKKHN